MIVLRHMEKSTSTMLSLSVFVAPLAVGLITWNVVVSQYWMTFHTNSVAMAANRSTNTLVRLQFSFAVMRTHATAFRTTQLRG